MRVGGGYPSLSSFNVGVKGLLPRGAAGGTSRPREALMVLTFSSCG